MSSTTNFYRSSSIIAHRLVNLYRQQHAIFGGWATVNPVFIKEATDDVIAELHKLPTGPRLAKHIENLRSGKTPMDSIENELLPYGGLMAQGVAKISLSETELEELREVLADFEPEAEFLEKIQNLGPVKKFGEEWLVGVRTAVAQDKELSEKWELVTKTARAFEFWKVANDITQAPLSERIRAQVQADLPEYETYLPMFGEPGEALLAKLRTFLSSV